jgi:hypothetical protein
VDSTIVPTSTACFPSDQKRIAIYASLPLVAPGLCTYRGRDANGRDVRTRVYMTICTILSVFHSVLVYY